MINLGFNDVYSHFHEDKEGYTFWDYMRGAWQKNNGMRIDHFLVSNSIIDQIKDININKDPRGREKPSDHTPIEINLAYRFNFVYQFFVNISWTSIHSILMTSFSR